MNEGAEMGKFWGSPAQVLNQLAADVHEANKKWWTDLETEEYPIKRNVGELLILQISELAEAAEESPEYNIAIMEITKHICKAMEGHRKNKMDDKLPHRKMFEVEMADCIIRIFDTCAGLGLDLGGAYMEKMAYNATRVDHTLEHRKSEHGKKY